MPWKKYLNNTVSALCRSSDTVVVVSLAPLARLTRADFSSPFPFQEPATRANKSFIMKAA